MTKSFASIGKGYAEMNGGVWVGNIPLPLFDGIRLKVRRLWNPDYRDLHDKLMEEHADVSEEANEKRITDECLIQTCLIGWEGVDDTFSVDTARGMLAAPDLGPVLRNAILWAAGTKIADQIAAEIEADAKNSPTP